MQISFGEFLVDLDQRRLFAEDGEIRLTVKGFELLKLLIENRPKALKKDELVAHLWPDTFVADNNLATLVADLRGALNDHPQEPRFIRTIYGYGYAFAGEATDRRQSAREHGSGVSGWTLLHEHREIPLNPGSNILGRSGSGVLILDSPTVSRHHARVSIATDGATVEDLGSKNGTWLGHTRVTETVRVKDGDRLRLGSLLVLVRFRPAVASTQTVASSPRVASDPIKVDRGRIHHKFISL